MAPPILSKPSGSARTAVAYITLGALMGVWSVIWFWYLHNNPPPGYAYYWCTGLLFTGLVLMVIGFTIGQIGRAARHAELPPEIPNPQPTAPPAVTSAPGGAAAVPGGATPAAPGVGGMPVATAVNPAAAGAVRPNGQGAVPAAGQTGTAGTAGVAPVAPVAPVAGAAPTPPPRQ
jgi:hypothetical protein